MKKRLQLATGKTTEWGKKYYEFLGVDPPKLYSYEQPLIHDKWVRTYEGKKTLARRWKPALNQGRGGWDVTKNGEN